MQKREKAVTICYAYFYVTRQEYNAASVTMTLIRSIQRGLGNTCPACPRRIALQRYRVNKSAPREWKKHGVRSHVNTRYSLGLGGRLTATICPESPQYLAITLRTHVKRINHQSKTSVFLGGESWTTECDTMAPGIQGDNRLKPTTATGTTSRILPVFHGHVCRLCGPSNNGLESYWLLLCIRNAIDDPKNKDPAATVVHTANGIHQESQPFIQRW
jgi:hypothetical protein